jgi:hypothetical protein
MAPHEMLYGEKPPLQHLRRLGCIAYKYIPKEQRKDKKFGIQLRPCMMLCYFYETTKICRIWDFNRGLHGGAVECSNVVFREDQNGYSAYRSENDDYDVKFPTDDAISQADSEDVDELTEPAINRSNRNLRLALNAIIVEKVNPGGSDEIDLINLR